MGFFETFTRLESWGNLKNASCSESGTEVPSQKECPELPENVTVFADNMAFFKGLLIAKRSWIFMYFFEGGILVFRKKRQPPNKGLYIQLINGLEDTAEVLSILIVTTTLLGGRKWSLSPESVKSASESLSVFHGFLHSFNGKIALNLWMLQEMTANQ